MSEKQPPSKVSELRDAGNNCIKIENYAEAVLHYTHAIKMDPKQYQLYSNRSHAFLKMDQLYFAHQDALTTIRLKPDWPKGYYRAGEVEFKAQRYKKAGDSYRRSLYLEPNDHVLGRLHTAQAEAKKMNRSHTMMPWYGVGFGILFGMCLVIGDQILAKSPVLNNPIFQTVIIIVITATGYMIGVGYRKFHVSQINSLLEAPLNLYDDESSNPFSNEESEKNFDSHERKEKKHHYKKATARQRYQKGKS